MSRILRPLALLLGSAAILSVGGCAYDYLQRTDRVGYSAGDAVKANLEAQTVNPARDSAYSVKGIGRNGYVEPKSPSGGMDKAPEPPTAN